MFIQYNQIMDYKENEEEKQEVNEPAVGYGALRGKKVRVFHSFEEQENEMIEYWASISPLQRLIHLHEMIKISFRLTESDIHSAPHSRKITITKYEA